MPKVFLHHIKYMRLQAGNISIKRSLLVSLTHSTMFIINHVKIWLILMFATTVSCYLGLSYNQPIFCSNVSWNPNGTTIADETIIGSYPWKIFITTNNTVYAPNRNTSSLIMWTDTNSTPTRNISLFSNDVRTFFITETYEIYYDYSWNSINGIHKITSDLLNDTSAMNTCTRCFDNFVDIQNNIYCSLAEAAQVTRKSLNNESDPIEIVAGIGLAGSTSYMLNVPNGIFVDTNLDLYVADSGNNRIQLFGSGQLNAITVAGNTSSIPTISLNTPVAVTLDANKYLFIADHDSNSIIANGPFGFRCILGCDGGGTSSDQLVTPRSIAFDSFGNIFIVDRGNHRIQKFFLSTNSCSMFHC